MSREAKAPCIVCGKALENVFEEAENQPYDATAFLTHGHYGSTVFDPMNGEYLEINVCDGCMIEKAAAGAILHGRDRMPVTIRGSIIGSTRKTWRLVPWNPALDADRETLNLDSYDEYHSYRDRIETRFSDDEIKSMFSVAGVEHDETVGRG